MHIYLRFFDWTDLSIELNISSNSGVIFDLIGVPYWNESCSVSCWIEFDSARTLYNKRQIKYRIYLTTIIRIGFDAKKGTSRCHTLTHTIAWNPWIRKKKKQVKRGHMDLVLGSIIAPFKIYLVAAALAKVVAIFIVFNNTCYLITFCLSSQNGDFVRILND